MNIAFIPSSSSFLNNNIFSPNFSRDNCLEPFFKLYENYNRNGWTINTYDLYESYEDINITIVSRFDNNLAVLLRIIKRNPAVKIVFIVTEEQNIAPLYIAPIIRSQLFDVILTWRDDMVDNKYYFKCNYPNPKRVMRKPISFQNRKYLTIINSLKFYNKLKEGDLYVERLKAIKYFAQYSEIDLYGIGWGKSESKLINDVYKGPVDSKIETLKHYKFALAFENSNNEIGGICEKIFDVMAAGCVPIYWGAPNVLDFIPKNSFIDFRDFIAYEKLDKYLKSIDDESYNEYLIAIKKFMESEAYLKYTSKGFVESVSKAVDFVNKKPSQKKSVISIKWEFIKKMFKYPKLFWNAKRFSFDLLFK
jgi:alpha(1,3/1,4) fucosyltransferase